MSEGVAIVFAVIFVLVGLIGFVLFKEVRTHSYWRDLVKANDIDAISGLLEAEIAHWRAMRPPKGINATVWAGVQGMELLAADTTHVQITTSAEPEMRVIDGKSQQVATALDIALATAVRITEMVFYDVADYLPDRVRIDVYTTFRDASGAVPQPILSLSADRADAVGLDWDDEPREIALAFDARYDLGPSGEPRPIDLPPIAPDLAASLDEAAAAKAKAGADPGDLDSESSDADSEPLPTPGDR